MKKNYYSSKKSERPIKHKYRFHVDASLFFDESLEDKERKKLVNKCCVDSSDGELINIGCFNTSFVYYNKNLLPFDFKADNPQYLLEKLCSNGIHIHSFNIMENKKGK